MKSKLLAGIIFILGFLAADAAHAQIVDDSTRLLYGPRTTLQLYEQDVLEGRYIEQRIDTAIQNMQNERYWYQDTAFYQHLGNIGTAAKPLFFQMPTRIGVRLGKNVFDRYAYNPEKINYYDTRSPYSQLYYIQGQRGEQVFEGIYARNITKRWNAGLGYQIQGGDRQIGTPGSRGRRGDPLTRNRAFKAFTHYRSENDRYNLFANFTLQRIEQIETGGIRPGVNEQGEVEPPDSLFRYEFETLYLSQATNQESRSNTHLMQIYKLAGEDLKLFHTIDWGRQQNYFLDAAIPYEGPEDNRTLVFYPEVNYSRNRTDDHSDYKELQNVFGVTGNSSVSLYKAYVKHRRAVLKYSSLSTGETAADTSRITYADAINNLFVGGQFRLNYEDKALLMLDGEFQLTRDYRVSATARIGRFEVSQSRVLRSPSLVEETMRSNHFVWSENFSNTVTDQSLVRFSSQFGTRQFMRLTANLTNIKRHIFLRERQNADGVATPRAVEPVQLDGNQTFYGVKLEHHIRFGGMHFENFIAYTNTDEAETIRIPELLLNSKAYFQGSLFRDALYGQFGVEMYLPSSYYADAFMPVIQQFYVQDEFKVKAYPVLDVFVTADIKSVNLFLKMSHVNEGLMRQQGYFATPYYPGMRRSFIFGLRWMFFD